MATQALEDVRLKLIEVRANLDDAISRMSLLISQPQPEPYVWGQPRPIVWGAKVSADFRASVLWIEEQLKLSADNLMACMAFETGVTFSPSVKNPNSSATGLIQFMSKTAQALGTSTSALAQMSAVRQLSYVYKYFRQFGEDLSSWNLADTYMAILLPSMIDDPLDAAMDWSAAAYRVNKGLDADKDGQVTKREAAAKVQAMFDLGSKPENMA